MATLASTAGVAGVAKVGFVASRTVSWINRLVCGAKVRLLSSSVDVCHVVIQPVMGRVRFWENDQVRCR